MDLVAPSVAELLEEWELRLVYKGLAPLSVQSLVGTKGSRSLVEAL